MFVVAGESLVDLLVDEAGAVDARLGGGPFNVARGLARLGVPCAFLGAVSGDRFGAQIRQALADDGVDLGCVVDVGAPTTLAVAHLHHGSASYAFYTAGTAAPALDVDDLRVLPGRIDGLHVGTLGLALEPMASTLEQLVAEADAATLVMVDPNVRKDMLLADAGAYRGRLGRVLDRADVVKVSTEDLALLHPGEDAVAAARGLLGGRTRCVLLTAGADAFHVLTEHGEREIGTVPVRVADTVGAGDAFCAGFLSRWTRDGLGVEQLGDLEAAVRAATFAALVAGITCQRVGADPPRLSEIPSASVLSW